jgi:hypothetical protein
MISAGFGKSWRNDPLVDFNGDSQKGYQQPPDPPDKEEAIYVFLKT